MKRLIFFIFIITFLMVPSYGDVMMQGFYWEVPDGGNWYNEMGAKAEELAFMKDEYGINRIWFPPPEKGMLGKDSRGYDPYDYYDLGEYFQHNTTETIYGSREELEEAINKFKALNISCMADIVLNHRGGAYSEYNPLTGENYWTDFSSAKSGKCLWHFNSFHPNKVCEKDNGTFGEPPFPDVCHRVVYDDIKEWLLWLRNDIGFDSWRFDYVKGFESWVVRDLKNDTANSFTIGEYWDGDVDKLDYYVNTTDVSVFDFPLFYTLKDICNDTSGYGYLPSVFEDKKSYTLINPKKSVTFVSNHDTDREGEDHGIVSDKMMAYAFILTYEGYPCIWWKDYFENGLKDLGGKEGNGIAALVWVREKLADGDPQINILQRIDEDLIIYESSGSSLESPGYIIAINDSPNEWKGFWVQSENDFFKGKKLECYCWYSSVSGENVKPDSLICDRDGVLRIGAPPRGYAVYSLKGF